SPAESSALLHASARSASLAAAMRDAGQAAEESQEDGAADAITERVGHLPLALDIVGALLRTSVPWRDIKQALDEGDLRFLHHGQQSVLVAIATSVQASPKEEQQRYHELVISPRAQPLDPEAVATLWSETARLKPRQSRRLLAALRERALLQADL